MCKRIFKEETNENGDIPFYKIGTFGAEADSYISIELFEEYKNKYPYPQKGDILISAAGTIGRCIFYKGENAYYQDSNIVWLKTNKTEIVSSFLYYFYSVAKWNGIEGSTIQRLYNSNILSTKINLPSLSEQTAIGNFFKQLDETIALHQRQTEKYQKLKIGFLESIFCTNLSPNNSKKTNAWEQRKLGEVLKIKSGMSQKDVEVENGIYPILATGGEIGRTNTALYSKESVLIGRKGTIDKPYYMNTPFWTVDTLFYSELSSYVTGQFIYTLFQKIKWRDFDTSTGVPSLTSATIHSIEVKIPSKAEQTAIGNFFKQLDETIALHQRQMEKYQQIKQLFLDKMFVK